MLRIKVIVYIRVPSRVICQIVLCLPCINYAQYEEKICSTRRVISVVRGEGVLCMERVCCAWRGCAVQGKGGYEVLHIACTG